MSLLSKNRVIILIFASLLFITGCEGLEDWSELKSIDSLLNPATEEESENDEFIRYSIPSLSSQPLVEYVNCDYKLSNFYSKEIRKVCDYTKIPFNTININSQATIKISPSTRVLVVFDTKKLSDASISKLVEFVSNGGTLFIPFASEDHRMAFLYGFKTTAEFATDGKSSGWFFITPMLPNLRVRSRYSSVVHYGFARENFSDKIKILATSLSNQNYPTVVENKIGSGRVLLYNTSSDFIKGDRGFLFAGILKGLEGIPYPIANTATIFLDDFPSPLYDTKVEPIKSEMNLNMADYVKKVWWPDMQKIAKEYKIPYSVMTTFDYRNKIVPPFTLDQWNTMKITTNNKTEPLPDWLVKDAAKNGHEIAFHGYNHVSLMTNYWKNQQFIATSLNTVKKKWEVSNFGKLPVTYVPPSNEIDENGVNELKNAMPSLKYMCSLFLGDLKEGGDREFDYDPYNKDFFDYPRISYGFYLDDDHKYNQESMYLFTGIWTHFIHPDDIYQLGRPGLSEEETADLRNGQNYGWYKTKGKTTAMLPEYKKYLKEKTNTFPQMRFVNAEDGAKIVMNWRASRYTHNSQNGVFTVKEKNAKEDKRQYWFLYSSKENANKIESYLSNQVEIFSKTSIMDGYLFSIYTKEPKLSMIDFHYKNEQQRAKQLAINNLVQADFNKYDLEAKKFLSGEIWVDNSDKLLKLELAALKKSMINDAVIDSIKWNKYAKHLSWDNRGEEAWKMLEDHVLKYPSKENVMYSKELDRIIGYPNDAVKEKWMSAQILVTPNDKNLLNSYVANFYTEDNQEKIKKTLKQLLTVDTSFDAYKNYIKFLLEFQPKEAAIELSEVKPSEKMAEFATQITWLYADNNDYQRAYDWSAYSDKIDFVTKMQWLIELRQFTTLENEYNKYIAENPNDNTVKSIMSNAYHGMGKFKESWIVANSMSDGLEKEALRKMLNKDVVFENEDIQQDLIAHQSALFYPDVLKAITKEYRLKKGDYVNFNTSLITNRDDLSSQEDILSYNHYDKKSNIHSFSGVYNKYYKQQFNEYYPSNETTALLGAQYGYTTAQKEGKPQYWSTAGILFDESTNPYFQFGLGLTSSKDKRFRSASLNVFPVETAAGINQKIYRAQLNLYQDFYLFKIISTSISIEGDYYTDGMIGRDTIVTPPVINPNRFARNVYTPIDGDLTEVSFYDDSYEGFATVRMSLDKGDIKKSKFIPYIEGQASLGSQDLANGYPYWMLEDRLYGGVGVGWQFMIPNFTSRIDASYFLDTYSDQFSRYTGNVTYQLFDYTALTLTFEFFNQEKYYSNSLQFGIKYNLKKRVKK